MDGRGARPVHAKGEGGARGGRGGQRIGRGRGGGEAKALATPGTVAPAASPRLSYSPLLTTPLRRLCSLYPAASSHSIRAPGCLEMCA